MQRDPDDLPLFQWRPPEKIRAFPAVRRRSWIRRRAETLASYRQDAAERGVQQMLQHNRDRLARLGLSSDAIERDTADLEVAIRAELGAVQARRGGAA